MRCKKCGKEIDGTPFCAYCGTKAEVKSCCPHCGKEVENTAFCPFCGKPLNTKKDKPVREGKREGQAVSRKKSPLAVMVLMAAVIVLVPVLGMMNGKKENNKVGTAETFPDLTHEEAVEAYLSDEPAEITVSGPILPDPGLFLNCERNEDGFSSSHNAYLLSYNFGPKDIGMTAVEEFVQLLQSPEYNLRLKDSSHEVVSWLTIHEYYFDYTGSYTVGQREYHDETVSNVYLLVNEYNSEGRIGFAFYYGDGFTVVDSGAETSCSLTDYTASAESAGGSSSGRKQCGTCHGSGKCNNCGGDGRVSNWRGDRYVDEDCTYCLTGDCPNANCLNGYE